MPNLRELRSRIKSVDSTSRVTKALQMIAAAKMKKAQDKVMKGRSYSEKLDSILSNVYSSNPELFSKSEKSKTDNNLLLLITPDRGLCGALVSNVIRTASNYLDENRTEREIFVLGKKGNSFMLRSKQEVSESFNVSDMPTFEEVSPISKIIIDKYSRGEFEQFNIIFSEFVSTAVQKARIKRLLPVDLDKENQVEASNTDFLYEPSIASVSKALIPRYIEMNIFNAVLNSIASEHSARLVAMQNATDNANELKQDLTLDLNKARQQQVTSEILDIIGGALALDN
ncbi:MAG: ATP synthase F1 subunit gamma [Chloroflexota bacterium]|tara:strand:- start:538 stop:1392 length:855 start_codon:yes stop_codon:yes gene_type:complete